MSATPWTELTTPSTNWTEGVSSGSTDYFALFLFETNGIQATAYTEMSIAATSFTEASVASTAWTELTL